MPELENPFLGGCVDHAAVKHAVHERRKRLQDLAKHLGIESPTLIHWLKSKRPVPLDHPRLQAIAEYVDKRPTDLLMTPQLENERILKSMTRRSWWPKVVQRDLDFRSLLPEALQLTRTLAEEIDSLMAVDDHNTFGAVDAVFDLFNDRSVRAQLPAIEAIADDIRSAAKGCRTAQFEPLTSGELVACLARVGVKVHTSDLSGRNLLSFISKRAGKRPDVLHLCRTLPGRTQRFELAKHLGYRHLQRPELQRLNVALQAFEFTPRIAGDELWVERFTREHVAQRIAAALILPQGSLVKDVHRTKCDMRILAREYRTSLETVARRLVCLGSLAGVRGQIPQFHFLKMDPAGNLIYRAGGDTTGVEFPRRLGACSKWAAVRAFQSPHEITRQWSEFPTGKRFFCFAFVVNEDEHGFARDGARYSIALGCPADEASQIVYADRLAKDWVRVGGACAVCEYSNCNVRAVRNVALEERYRSVATDEFALIRKRRPLAPLTKEDVQAMRRCASERP